VTVEAPSEPDVRRRGFPRDRRPLGEHVAGVIAELQRRYLDDRADAIAALAQLRGAVNAEPGAAGLPEACWLPDELLEIEYRTRDEASPSERVLHTAVTLWAVHQQSRRDECMHMGGTPFAVAVQRLAALRRPAGMKLADDPVYRRFTAMGTAPTYRELAHHARGLIAQLRDARIGFDYGLFADDLRTFQRRIDPATGLTGPDRVRALWGREYWRAAPGKAAASPVGADDAASANPSDDQE
jgi:CRISPR system Cascade subunit CasB